MQEAKCENAESEIQNARRKMQNAKRPRAGAALANCAPPCSLCILPFALLICRVLPPQAPHDPSIITIAVRSGPNSLDPRLSNDEGTQRMSQLVYSPLLEHGDDLRIRPALALRFDNPDPLTYIVYLRHGVTFHDGHELTSRDVVYTFKSILDPALLSPFEVRFEH